jgi:hypothetical protein
MKESRQYLRFLYKVDRYLIDRRYSTITIINNKNSAYTVLQAGALYLPRLPLPYCV